MDNSTTNETELKYHVPKLPNPAALAEELTALGWHVYGTTTKDHSDTYMADQGGQLANLRAALRWRCTGNSYVVAIKQELGTDGAHFERFELEVPTDPPAQAAHGLVLGLDTDDVPPTIAAWLAANSVAGPLVTLAWLVTTRTVLRAGATGVLAEFALDRVQARVPGGEGMHEFYEVECEYQAETGHPLIHNTADLLARLPGAAPSWASKLDVALAQFAQ